MHFLENRRRLITATAGVGLLGLTGCATQTALLRAHAPDGLPRHVELAATPFFPQEAYQCGPAALATVLGAAGRPVQPEALVGEVFLPGRQGSLQIEMLAGARRAGALAVELPPTLEAVMAETAAGHPVAVLLNLGLSWAPTWHYAVVIGYDLDDANFLLRSGTIARQELAMRTFEFTWARSQYWAFVALAPGALAATADEAATTRALVAFEKAAPAAAAVRAYRPALARWPDSLVLAMGLGNSLYAAGEREAAAAVFREAAQKHDAAAAWNNLAVILLEARRFDDARTAARRAVELGGPELDAARDTLSRIEAGR